MPELPEVETVVRDLRPLLVGRTIQRVVCGKRKLRRPWKPAWNKAIAGLMVTAIRRRGKWIIVDGRAGSVSDRSSGSLLLHLGMTGQLTVAPETVERQDHTHLVYLLDNESELRFRDVRRFGSADWFASSTLLDEYLEAKLGPEPFDITSTEFRTAVRGSARCLKAILLDQALLAGVGNIYADEACFLARLHPGRRGRSLSNSDCDRLREAIVLVLTNAIEGRGSTIRNYVGGSGLKGNFQNEFNVYGRTGEPCPKCTTAIEMTRIAGRSSHHCKRCQK